MSYLYLTADKVGMQSGGGVVTQNEMTALLDLAIEEKRNFKCLGRDEFKGNSYIEDPWCWDEYAEKIIQFTHPLEIELAHIYAGTFTKTVVALKRRFPRCKIAYTAAAHDISLSQREHERLRIPFNYPHLTDAALWERYVGGYRAADVVICPSYHSEECMKRYGCKQVEVIPHGVEIPEHVVCPPATFRVGYLGAVGPDKGLIYLLQAWKKLNYSDAKLVIAGRDSTSEFVQSLIHLVYRQEVPNYTCSGVGHSFDPKPISPQESIELVGWVPRVDSFYNSIYLYIQPSVTEGFGIEVLEAIAHGRAVLCSRGAGAADVVPEEWRFPAADSDALAEKIDQFRRADLGLMGKVGRNLACQYKWPLIHQRYQEVWRTLL